MEQRALNVAEAARVLNVHPLTIRKAITRGELRAVRIGRKVLVPVAAIDASWTHAQPQQANYRANDLAGKNGPPPRLPATRRRLASGSVASCRRLGEVSMVVATLTPFNRIVAALEARGCRRQGHDFQCPAHDDNRASLSVRAARDRVLIHCHAECSVEDVVAALGLQMADLFESGGERLTDSTICATYDYTNETGELLFQVVRSWPKSFRQRRPNGNGGWEWNLDGVRRVPFHLPQLVEGLKNGSTIYVVEGEKDVLAIEKAGGVATCNPGGVGKWRVEYSDHLAGANVVVVADKDDPGRKHAEAVASSLRDRAHRVSIVEPAEGKDASDHLGAGKVLADFVPLVPASRKERRPPADLQH